MIFMASVSCLHGSRCEGSSCETLGAASAAGCERGMPAGCMSRSTADVRISTRWPLDGKYAQSSNPHHGLHLQCLLREAMQSCARPVQQTGRCEVARFFLFS